MARITQQSIENVRQRADLAEIAGAYVNLKRVGANLQGLSPFGHEKTPSFYVLPEKGIFKCFSSGNGGDVFTFVQLMENMDFHESVECLAQRLHVTLEYEKGASGGDAGQTRSLRKALEALHEEVARYFHEQLRGHARMRDYWTRERGFKWESAEAFGIGWAPESGQALVQHLKKQGVSAELLRQSGLFYTRENAPQYFKCRFRGRLMIPIRDIQGRVVAFTGRQSVDTPQDDPTREAKYVNSPETVLFKKGQLLFGLDQARKALREGTWPLVLVEGQLDALRLWECGVKTALAPQGTAMTAHQMALIKRYTQELVCFFDGDAAGQKAALRLLPMALEKGIEPRIVKLNPDEDPDAWMQAHGAQGLRERIRCAQSPISFALEAVLPAGQPHTAIQKQAGLQELYGLIAHVESAVQQQDYLHELGYLSGVGVDSLTSDYRLFLSKNNKSRLKPKPGEAFYRKSPSQEKTSELLTNPEFELLFIFLHRDDLCPKIAHAMDPGWIRSDRVWGALLKKILSAYREGLWEGVHKLDAVGLDEEEKQRVYTLLAQESEFKHLEETVEVTLQALFVQHCKARLQALNHSIASTDPTDVQTLQALQKERVQLRNYIKKPEDAFHSIGS